jgi:release factor glutamine methyltransferase
MNLKDFKYYFIKQLTPKYDLEECTSLFYIVIDKMLHTNRIKFNLVQEAQMDLKVENELKSVIEQLREEKPIQYILSEAYFFGYKFFVNASVLIPRPETEELVGWILESLSSLSLMGKKALDIGTGSGCIPVALKKNAHELELHGLDISSEALEVAARNALSNNVEIKFIRADIFTLQSADIYDIIVSNPPYIKEVEKAQMHENVLAYEPHTALFVSDEDPLVFYKQIAEFSKKNLSPDGFLFFEINAGLGMEMEQMLAEKGFKEILLRKDMQGKDRMIRCQLQ